MNMNEIGDFLKSLRKSKGLTQTELADMLNVSNKTVSKWENGLGIPEMSTLLLLADIYDVSVDDILRGSKKMSKNEDKAIDRFQYLIHKSRHQYINHLILSLSIIILGIIAFSITSATNQSFAVIISLTITFAVASQIVQILNIMRIRYQMIELKDTSEYIEVSKMILNTSILMFFAALCLTNFVFFRYYYFLVDELMDAMMYSSILPAISVAFIQAAFIYLVVRIIASKKFQFALGRITKIFIVSLLAIIVLPFLILSIFPARDVAIALDWSGVNKSTYDIDISEGQYYRLRLLWLIEEEIKAGGNPDDVYEIVMHTFYSNTANVPTVYYHFNEPTEYDLYVEQSYFDDSLFSLDYSNFVVSDEVISAYWFWESDTHLAIELYGYIFGNLLSIWMMAGVLVILVKGTRKERKLNS